jgi:hypothetical protein
VTARTDLERRDEEELFCERSSKTLSKTLKEMSED